MGPGAHAELRLSLPNLAKQARGKQACARTGPPKVASFSNARAGVGQIIKRACLVDLAHIRGQPPLPETADELCAVARDLKVGVEDVRLGARAGETDLKGLSEQGALANYRVLHFASHGALSGGPGRAARPCASSSAS